MNWAPAWQSMPFHMNCTIYPLEWCVYKQKKGFRFVVEYYLLLPSVSLLSTANLPDLGKTMYSMYSKHRFPSVTLWGQKASPIFSFTWDCSKQLDHEHHSERKGIKHWLTDVSVQKKGVSWLIDDVFIIQVVEKNLIVDILKRTYIKRNNLTVFHKNSQRMDRSLTFFADLL